MAYPEKLAQIIEFFESLPEDERRQSLIDFAQQVPKFSPRAGEKYDLEDVRKDEECTDSVGIFMKVEGTQRAAFHVSLGPQVQTLTKAMSAILCKGLEGSTLQEIVELPSDFVTKIVGGQLVRVRSQTVYYILTRIKSACRVLLNRSRAAQFAS